MNAGAGDDVSATRQAAPRGASRGRIAAIVIGALAAVVVLAMAGAWQVLRAHEDTFSCPPQEWAQGLAADVQSLLPPSAIWTDPTISDCDDLRAVTAESVPVTGTESDLSALQTAVVANARRSGWSGVDGSHCLEQEIDGLATRLDVDAGGDGDVVTVQASRGGC